MALVDRETLRANHERVAGRLKADDGFGLMRPYVTATLVRDVSVECSFEQYDRPFTFHGDEAADRGGHETGPSPMRYLLSGVAFCLLGWIAKASALEGVELSACRTHLRTFLDMRGEHGVGDVPANPQWLVIETEVESEAPEADVLRVLDHGRTHCPLTVLVGRAIPVWERVTLNGRVIRDTVPAEAA